MRNILILAVSAIIGFARADYNNQCNDNIVDYWGQNSYGAANGNDPSGWQQPLKFYCDDDSVDVLPISFLTTFFGVGGEPQINLANYCNSVDNATFPGTGLANCQNIAPEIEYCQKKGKLITLSLGGATGGAGFQSDAQATAFADTIWNLFLGGSSKTRPFGDAVLDGIDLDIEGGGPNYYVTFLNKLNTYFKSSSKKYYVTAAPQCVYPDANLQTALNGYPFDAVYVQFYNNPCGLQNYNSPSQWNFGTWDIWARTISPNPDVKIYIGAPASASAAGGGYVPADTLLKIALATRAAFPSFGGVMFWDASQAHKNNQIDAAMKNGMKSGKKCDNSFVYPTCTAPAFVAGNTYTNGATVSYKGYMWTTKWWTATVPNGSVTSDWSPISACAGGTLGDGSTSVTTKTVSASATTSSTTSTTSPSTTSTTSVSASTTIASTSEVPTTSASATTTSTSAVATSSSTPLPADSCTGVDSWSSTAAYTSGKMVIYNSELWKAAWWSLNDKPGGTSGAWTKVKSCPSIAARSVAEKCNHTRWSKRKTYKVGSKVMHKREVFVASKVNNNQSPDIHVTVWAKDGDCS
ncbi:class III chitinase [Mucor mucedo]|uniref:class III chitinase n=1 Tax=Mucor mucedo TaxID=29922 RepID=UPI0022211E2D|nr:class III chitinase [Mucor mucedo]KAI7891555.1 class III chitinase [Mucor mucedo]